MAIPKRIITYWLNHDPNSLPASSKECIDSQIDMCEKFGYEHKILTIEDCNIGSRYMDECLSRGDTLGYVKASDYLRIYWLWRYGGVILDADMAILPGKNFDHLLNNKMFLSRECAFLLANAAIGAEAGHPLLKNYLEFVENNFRGSGEDVYCPGIKAFDDNLWYFRKKFGEPEMTILPTETFFPYNHLTGVENITSDTIVYHKYAKSWVK